MTDVIEKNTNQIQLLLGSYWDRVVSMLIQNDKEFIEAKGLEREPVAENVFVAESYSMNNNILTVWARRKDRRSFMYVVTLHLVKDKSVLRVYKSVAVRNNIEKKEN